MLRRTHQVHDRRTSEIVNDEASIPAIVLSINLFKLLKIAGFCQDCDHSEGGMIGVRPSCFKTRSRRIER
jgi:hypothetical protein